MFHELVVVSFGQGTEAAITDEDGLLKQSKFHPTPGLTKTLRTPIMGVITARWVLNPKPEGPP